MSNLKLSDVVYVAGHQGMVGTAIIKQLKKQGVENIITRSHSDLDLCDQSAVTAFFSNKAIDVVVLAAAKVGGIHANNTYPAEFIYQNLMIEANVIHAAWKAEVSQLLFLGSSCIYPKLAAQPMKESELLSGALEPSNEPYAIAKIAGIKLCESYNRQYGVDCRSVMPTNLYGENDNFHPENSHVIPAMIRRFHQAKVSGTPHVVIWGTGKPMREFLHVDDMAAACLYIMQCNKSDYAACVEPMLSHINVGTGMDCSIRELAYSIKDVVGFEGELIFDDKKLDGTARKRLDVSRLKQLGWQATISLDDGLQATYQWFLAHERCLRGQQDEV